MHVFLTSQDHTDTVNSIAWSPDGRLLASACDDMQLRLFDVHELSNQNLKFRKVELKQGPVGVGFGNDGGSLVAALRGRVILNGTDGQKQGQI